MVPPFALRPQSKESAPTPHAAIIHQDLRGHKNHTIPGYKVIEAANAEEAMTVLSHKETVINLVFTDIKMPGALDGFGLAQWVREHKPGIDVLLAGTLPRAVQQAKELCEEGPVPKPYDAQAVGNHIRQLLAARRAVKPTE
jgi:DNA-binding NtrC family response regulator